MYTYIICVHCKKTYTIDYCLLNVDYLKQNEIVRRFQTISTDKSI